jgi:hypothetical protein
MTTDTQEIKVTLVRFFKDSTASTSANLNIETGCVSDIGAINEQTDLIREFIELDGIDAQFHVEMDVDHKHYINRPDLQFICLSA